MLQECDAYNVHFSRDYAFGRPAVRQFDSIGNDEFFDYSEDRVSDVIHDAFATMICQMTIS
jgi:hypothetical protein